MEEEEEEWGQVIQWRVKKLVFVLERAVDGVIYTGKTALVLWLKVGGVWRSLKTVDNVEIGVF